MRKKYYLVIVAVALLSLACLSGALLYRQHVHAKELDKICSSSIALAYDAFLDYASSGSEVSYLFGVSCFHTFRTLYAQSSFYESDFIPIISLAYARLLYHKDLVKHDLAPLLDALKILKSDCSSINGYTNLQTFVNP